MSSTNLGSMLIFASCVLHRSLVFNIFHESGPNLRLYGIITLPIMHDQVLGWHACVAVAIITIFNALVRTLSQRIASSLGQQHSSFSSTMILVSAVPVPEGTGHVRKHITYQVKYIMTRRTWYMIPLRLTGN